MIFHALFSYNILSIFFLFMFSSVFHQMIKKFMNLHDCIIWRCLSIFFERSPPIQYSTRAFIKILFPKHMPRTNLRQTLYETQQQLSQIFFSRNVDNRAEIECFPSSLFLFSMRHHFPASLQGEFLFHTKTLLSNNLAP